MNDHASDPDSLAAVVIPLVLFIVAMLFILATGLPEMAK